jgi:ankyrin repeat protein
MKFKKIFFLSLLLCTLFSFYSWSLDPKISIDDYLVFKWDRFDSLPPNSINSITQIKNGADIHMRDLDGKTALALAAAYGHENVCKILLKKKSHKKIKIQTPKGRRKS